MYDACTDLISTLLYVNRLTTSASKNQGCEVCSKDTQTEATVCESAHKKTKTHATLLLRDEALSYCGEHGRGMVFKGLSRAHTRVPFKE